MIPILAPAAASVAGNIIHSIADTVAKGTAPAAAAETPAVPFSTLIDKATGTAATQAKKIQDLTSKLSQSSEVAGAAAQAGVTGPVNLQIDASGDAAIRLPNGSLKPVQLSQEMRAVSHDLYAAKQAPAASGFGSTATARTARPGGPITVSLS